MNEQRGERFAMADGAIADLQTYTGNLCASLVQLGGFVEQPEMKLTQERRDTLEMMEATWMTRAAKLQS